MSPDFIRICRKLGKESEAGLILKFTWSLNVIGAAAEVSILLESRKEVRESKASTSRFKVESIRTRREGIITGFLWEILQRYVYQTEMMLSSISCREVC